MAFYNETVTLNAAGNPIRGLATNTAAATGFVGEKFTVSLLESSAVALTTGTPQEIGSGAALTAGVWEIAGMIGFLPVAGTSITVLQAGISITTSLPSAASIGVPDASFQLRTVGGGAAFVPGTVEQFLVLPTYEIILSGTVTYHLIAQATFTVNTLSAFGFMQARRTR